MELDLRFNTSLFKSLVLPNIRMIGVVYTQLTKNGDKEKVERQFRKSYRSFCCLPWTSPNELVEKMIGQVATVLESMAKVVEHKSNCRHRAIPIDLNLIRFWKSRNLTVKFVPRKITTLLKEMYGRKCKTHNATMNRQHLREEHGIFEDPLHMIDRYQTRGERRQIKYEIKIAFKKIEEIAQVRVNREGTVRRGVCPRKAQ